MVTAIEVVSTALVPKNTTLLEGDSERRVSALAGAAPSAIALVNARKIDVITAMIFFKRNPPKI
jgi:hypothetical protein